MILQLDPQIPMTTPKGDGFAILALDYSQDHNLIWVVADDATGEVWAWSNSEIRMQANVTFGRPLC